MGPGAAPARDDDTTSGLERKQSADGGGDWRAWGPPAGVRAENSVTSLMPLPNADLFLPWFRTYLLSMQRLSETPDEVKRLF